MCGLAIQDPQPSSQVFHEKKCDNVRYDAGHRSYKGHRLHGGKGRIYKPQEFLPRILFKEVELGR
jgi:hypothetical protein